MARYKCSKGIVGFLCCVKFLIGATLFINGMLLRVSSGYFGNEVVVLFNRVEYNHVEFGYLLSALVYALIVHGAFVMFICVFGMFASVKRDMCGLKAFFVMNVLLIIAEAVCVGFWVYFRGRSDEWLRGEMLDLLSQYIGPEATDDTSKGWNKLFIEAQCCGVIDQFANGDTTGDFQDTQSIWYNTNANSEKVPATCCQGVDEEDISSTINTACTTTPKDYYTKGCYTRLVDLTELSSIILFCSAGTLLILQLLAMLGACLLLDRGNKVSHMSRVDRPPTPYVAMDRVMRTKF